jgi:predicted RNase H-like HicB family nuclease
VPNIVTVKYRAIIKQSDNWWIGWIVDLLGGNAQERTKAEVIRLLKIGAEDMLATEVAFEPDAFMTTISVPDPE